MTGDASERGKRLVKLARWRSSELETARTVHVTLARATSEKKSALDSVETEIEQMQSYVRNCLTDPQALSADSLRRFNEFAAVKAGELADAQAALVKSRADSDAAHALVVRRFEGLSAVERLQERLRREADRDSMRRGQKQLDEQALSRSGGVDGADRREE